MDEDIIIINNVSKIFKVPVKSKEGLISAIKSLFIREYKYIKAVDNVNLNIKKGEIRGLIGPNGAGKSTLIKMISGILYPTSGTIKVMGLTPWSQRRKYVQKIGVLLGQKSQLIWELPPIDTFALNKTIYKIPDKIFKENLEYFKDILQLEEIIKKPVRDLSLGERMKCEFVCALLHDPELVYLDEPTIGLDIIAKDSIRKFIRAINHEKNITFILTTHDLSDIEKLCENITVINKGSIVFNNTLDKLKVFFSNKKVIQIKFTRQIEEKELEKYHVLEFSKYSAAIEIDLSRKDQQSKINGIFKRLPVKDIVIENINIEDVIKKIYKN
jgi:ABC-2 type transport system ATP-binding protein